MSSERPTSSEEPGAGGGAPPPNIQEEGGGAGEALLGGGGGGGGGGNAAGAIGNELRAREKEGSLSDEEVDDPIEPSYRKLPNCSSSEEEGEEGEGKERVGTPSGAGYSLLSQEPDESQSCSSDDDDDGEEVPVSN